MFFAIGMKDPVINLLVLFSVIVVLIGEIRSFETMEFDMLE